MDVCDKTTRDYGLTDDEEVDVDGVEYSDLNKITEVGEDRVVLVVASAVVKLQEENRGEVVLVAEGLLVERKVQGGAEDVWPT